MMISIPIRVLICTLLLVCSQATPIKEFTAVWPSRRLDEFLDGEVVCTGHFLEENFEEKLASAAASECYLAILMRAHKSARRTTHRSGGLSIRSSGWVVSQNED